MPSSRIWSLRLQVGRDRVYGTSHPGTRVVTVSTRRPQARKCVFRICDNPRLTRFSGVVSQESAPSAKATTREQQKSSTKRSRVSCEAPKGRGLGLDAALISNELSRHPGAETGYALAP